jgi:ABC-2 type transport system permease protein
VAFTVVAYLGAVLGAALSWPSWVLDVFAFTHLAWVPADPWAATSGSVMAATGIAMAVLGFVLFRRRDVVGS